MKRPMLASSHDSGKRLHQARGREEYQLRHEHLVATKTTEKPLPGLDYISRLGPFRAAIAAATSRSR